MFPYTFVKLESPERDDMGTEALNDLLLCRTPRPPWVADLG